MVRKRSRGTIPKRGKSKDAREGAGPGSQEAKASQGMTSSLLRRSKSEDVAEERSSQGTDWHEVVERNRKTAVGRRSNTAGNPDARRGLAERTTKDGAEVPKRATKHGISSSDDEDEEEGGSNSSWDSQGEDEQSDDVSAAERSETSEDSGDEKVGHKASPLILASIASAS